MQVKMQVKLLIIYTVSFILFRDKLSCEKLVGDAIIGTTYRPNQQMGAK